MSSKKKPGKKSAHEKEVEQIRLALKVMLALIEPGGLDVDKLAAKLAARTDDIEEVLVGLQESRYQMKSLDAGKGKRWKAVGETVGLIGRLNAAYRDPDAPPDVDPETARKIVFAGRLLGRKKEGKPLNLLERNLCMNYELTMPLSLREELIREARKILGPKWDEPAMPIQREDVLEDLRRSSRTIDPAARREAEEMLEEMRREQQHQGPVHVKAKGKEVEIGKWVQSLSKGGPKKRGVKSKKK